MGPTRKPSPGCPVPTNICNTWNSSKKENGSVNNEVTGSNNIPSAHRNKVTVKHGGESVLDDVLRSCHSDINNVLNEDLKFMKVGERNVVVDTNDQTDNSEDKEVMEEPYHTRYDSKPFSYIRQNPSAPNSRNLSRASSKETLEKTYVGQGLESPSLLRRVIGIGGNPNRNEEKTPPALPAFGNQ